jgi:hypothetical protein
MSGRRIGAAAALGVVLALVFDLSLRFALDAIRVVPAGTHWEGIVASKSIWLIAVVAASAVVPLVIPLARAGMDRPEAFRVAGVLLIGVPLIWTFATLTFFVLRLAVAGEWGGEGRLLLQPAFYADLFTRNGPWLLAGAALRALSRHVRQT